MGLLGRLAQMLPEASEYFESGLSFSNTGSFGEVRRNQ
jgi:hypothetical protein